METIKSSKDIDLIFKCGRKLFFPYFNLIIYKDNNNQINGNVAFIAGKKNGNAVWRNKSKRRLREIYKKINLNKNYKLLLIANKNLLKYDFDEIINFINNEKIE